jgi:NAD+ kinase
MRALLSPDHRPSALLLVADERDDLLAKSQSLVPLISPHAEVAIVPLSANDDLSKRDFDLAFVFGGDGSILRSAFQMGVQQRPVVGINMGKLGFLADLTLDEFLVELPNICAGKYPVVEHLMFDCRVERNGKPICQHLGLNEVTIFAGPPFAILDVDLYVDSELVTTYSCDGLIISTPIGSTAHNLSAGGPILRQDLAAFVISPISPHTLTNRPVVDAADRVFELVVPRPHKGTTVVADGRVLTVLQPGDRVRVTQAAARFQLIKVAGRSYYRTLREKLGWSGQLRRPEK